MVSEEPRLQDKEQKVKESEVAQSCLTLCDPVDCGLPGSSVHGILQASINGHKGCFHVLATVKSIAMNIGMHVPFQIMDSSG